MGKIKTEDIIKVIQDNLSLWNARKRTFKERKIMYEKLGKKLNMSGEDLRSRLHNIRDQFTREHNSRQQEQAFTKEGRKRRGYQYYEELLPIFFNNSTKLDDTQNEHNESTDQYVIEENDSNNSTTNDELVQVDHDLCDFVVVETNHNKSDESNDTFSAPDKSNNSTEITDLELDPPVIETLEVLTTSDNFESTEQMNVKKRPNKSNNVQNKRHKVIESDNKKPKVVIESGGNVRNNTASKQIENISPVSATKLSTDINPNLPLLIPFNSIPNVSADSNNASNSYFYINRMPVPSTSQQNSTSFVKNSPATVSNEGKQVIFKPIDLMGIEKLNSIMNELKDIKEVMTENQNEAKETGHPIFIDLMNEFIKLPEELQDELKVELYQLIFKYKKRAREQIPKE